MIKTNDITKLTKTILISGKYTFKFLLSYLKSPYKLPNQYKLSLNINRKKPIKINSKPKKIIYL